jgi:DNA primase
LIPESFITELKYHSSIEQIVSSYVQLKRAGKNLKGLCPFHSEKTPSFTVYPDNQSFYCFGCGAGGDVVTFIRRIENLDYPEAVRFLAAKAGMTVPEDGEGEQSARQKMRILELNRMAARFYHDLLISEKGREALAYLHERGLSDKTIRRFGLGWAPPEWDALKKHLTLSGCPEEELAGASLTVRGKSGSTYDLFRGRIIFPIIDIRGGVIGFGGRVTGEGGPKYLNSPDTPVFKKSRNLFALNAAKNTKDRRLILAEGYMDVITLHQAGFANAVATLGTALTPEQARLISQYADEVVVAYDSDQAGRQAARRAVELFDQLGVRLRVLSLKDAKDPDEYIKKFGAKRFAMTLEQSLGAVEFELERLRQRHDIQTDEGKIAFIRAFCEMLADCKNPIERDVYLSRVAQELSVDKQAMGLEVDSVRRRRERKQQQAERRDLRPFTEFQPGRPRDPQRSRHPGCVVAEEGLIALLVKNPDYFEHIRGRIAPEQFVTEHNRALYSAVCQRLEACKPVDITAMASQLDMEQTARLSRIVNGERALNHTPKEADDYIGAILSVAEQPTTSQLAAMNVQELDAFRKKISAGKKK